jgi:hypothetical protein
MYKAILNQIFPQLFSHPFPSSFVPDRNIQLRILKKTLTRLRQKPLTSTLEAPGFMGVALVMGSLVSGHGDFVGSLMGIS